VGIIVPAWIIVWCSLLPKSVEAVRGEGDRMKRKGEKNLVRLFAGEQHPKRSRFSGYAKLKFNVCFFEKTLRKYPRARLVPMNKLIKKMGY
jgi:hypothetical protein